jgi:hypothetical protein
MGSLVSLLLLGVCLSGVPIVCCRMAKLLLGVDVGISRRSVCRRWVDDEEDGCRLAWKLW